MGDEQWKLGIAYPPDDPRWPHNQPSYRMFVNYESTVYVRVWSNGEMEVAFRGDPGAVWGPPIRVVEEAG